MLCDESKKEIADRLRYFAHMKFGSLKLLAKELGVTSSTLSQYATGKSIPGNTMQNRLREIGCDVEWLMTGNSEKMDAEVISIPNEFKLLRRDFTVLMKDNEIFNLRLQRIETALESLSVDINLFRRDTDMR
ncbi:hypothetical protein MASR1M107_32760 [Ignavibacteriales bacterium]